MNVRPSIYRSTLIAAALAIGSLGITTAEAHESGWRGHDRGWHGHEHGWRDRDGERGWYRGDAPRADVWLPAVGAVGYGWAPGYAPPVGYAPGGVAVTIRLPF